MTYRLYFYLMGADEDRPGGPWWYRDFHSAERRSRFFGDIERFLHAHVSTEGEYLPYHDPMDIHPPE